MVRERSTRLGVDFGHRMFSKFFKANTELHSMFSQTAQDMGTKFTQVSIALLCLCACMYMDAHSQRSSAHTLPAKSLMLIANKTLSEPRLSVVIHHLRPFKSMHCAWDSHGDRNQSHAWMRALPHKEAK
jgi:hypothetical protein